jgi:hypothetical protein
MNLRSAIRVCALLPAVATMGHAPAVRTAAQDRVIPQTALGTCLPLSMVEAREIPPGTGVSVSPDGRWLAQYIHTSKGGEVRLFERVLATTASSSIRVETMVTASQPAHTLTLQPPSLPGGVQWRILEARFSADAELLAVRTVGAVFVISAQRGVLVHTAGFDKERQAWPGQISFGGSTVAVVYWLPDSAFAQHAAQQRVEVRLLEAATGKWLRSLLIPIESSDAWTKISLSPDGARLALLLRPELWPGKSRLRVHDTSTGKDNGELKIAAEDLDWSADGRELLLLGSRLVWLDSGTGKEIRKAEGDAGASEFQKLRVSEAANLAAGHFTRFSAIKRTIRMNDQRDTALTIWRLQSGEQVCRVSFLQTTTVQVWPTAQGELVALEETWEANSEKRQVKSARVVTYRLVEKQALPTACSVRVGGLKLMADNRSRISPERPSSSQRP